MEHLLATIKSQVLDIVIITETWKLRHMAETKDFLFLQSRNDEKRAEGILIIANKKSCCLLQPTFVDFANKNHQLAVIHIKVPGERRVKRIIIHGVYANPEWNLK